jgi:hypothetical protein
MRVPQDALNCVVFIRSEHSDSLVPRGTGFFVSVSWQTPDPLTTEVPDRKFVYLVTARHVIAGIIASSKDPVIHVRINRADGGWTCLDSSPSQWIFPSDDSTVTDVAAMLWNPKRPEQLRLTHVPTELFGTEDMIADGRIGLGDELFIPGLFSRHVETFENVPIVRIGNIAAMPGELVKTELGLMKAYLVETRSIGGLIGAPAFLFDATTDRVVLLGLIHGHWDTRIDSGMPPSATGTQGGAVNMGISIVIPSGQIALLLNEPVFRKVREDAQAKRNPFREKRLAARRSRRRGDKPSH